MFQRKIDENPPGSTKCIGRPGDILVTVYGDNEAENEKGSEVWQKGNLIY